MSTTPLAEALRDRIRREGPISFREFMEAALYDATHGYYARGPAIGPAGDFSTSARFPAFSRALARLAVRAWEALGRPGDFRVVEVGGGAGDVARGVTRALAEAGVPHEYVTVDVSAGLRVAQRAAGAARAVPSFGALDAAPGLLIANEVLDALPVHRVLGTPEGLREIYVDVDARGKFAEVLRAPSTPALAARLADADVSLAEGHVAEVCLDHEAFFRDAARAISTGYALVIDYGDDAQALYARPGGTLATYSGHARGSDPYARVGEQDVTADVDFTAATATAARAGFTPLLRSEQGALLWALGLAEEARAARERNDAALLEEIAFLCGPAGLGSAFEALLFAKDAPPLF